MFTHPGTKLLFMGAEFGQSTEWKFDGSLDWHLLEFGYHKGIKKVITDLNALYKNYPALHEKQFSPDGFEWINYSDHQNAVMSYIRKGNNSKENLIVVCNFTPVVHTNYRIGIPTKGKLSQIFNSDSLIYGGSGVDNDKPIKIDKTPWNGRDFSADLVLPPLSVVVFKMS
jgi:1,4-alpha-glucan branching enzyme